MSDTDDVRPPLVLVAEPGPGLPRLLTSIMRFNRDGIPVATEPRDGTTVVLAAETVFVRQFGYDDFLDAAGRLRLFWTHDGDRRAAGAVTGPDDPPASWEEPILLDLRGLPASYSLAQATESDIARGYVGYIGDLPTSEDPLARIPARELLRAAARSAYAKTPRLQRILKRGKG